MINVQQKQVTLSKTAIIWIVVVIVVALLGREAYHYYKHQADANSISTLRKTILAEYTSKETALINNHIQDIDKLNERAAAIVQSSDVLIATNAALVNQLKLSTYKSKIVFNLTLAEALKCIDDYEYSSTTIND